MFGDDPSIPWQIAQTGNFHFSSRGYSWEQLHSSISFKMMLILNQYSFFSNDSPSASIEYILHPNIIRYSITLTPPPHHSIVPVPKIHRKKKLVAANATNIAAKITYKKKF